MDINHTLFEWKGMKNVKESRKFFSLHSNVVVFERFESSMWIGVIDGVAEVTSE